MLFLEKLTALCGKERGKAMIINGKNESLERNMTLAELLEQLGYRQNLLAVELNGQIVKRAEYVSTMLTDSDKLEIVSFVGGG